MVVIRAMHEYGIREVESTRRTRTRTSCIKSSGGASQRPTATAIFPIILEETILSTDNPNAKLSNSPIRGFHFRPSVPHQSPSPFRTPQNLPLFPAPSFFPLPPGHPPALPRRHHGRHRHPGIPHSLSPYITHIRKPMTAHEPFCARARHVTRGSLPDEAGDRRRCDGWMAGNGG